MRAALQGTPGGFNDDSFKDVLFQVGTTPLSAENASLSRSQSHPSFSRRSFSRRASEKSSGLSSSRAHGARLADLLEEMQEEGQNLLEALPTVGEEPNPVDNNGGLSQFSLIETETPSALSLANHRRNELLQNTIDVLV